MPMPLSEPTGAVPSEFDPEKHCGALRRINKEEPDSLTTVCMRKAGVLNGRCQYHGGRAKVRSAASKSPAVRQTIMERAIQIKNSDELLTLDNEIAVMKAIVETKFEKYSELQAAALIIIDKIEKGEMEGESAPALTLSDIDDMVDLSSLDVLNRMIKTAYDMRFSKRFSIPVSELESIIGQIKDSFVEVCQRFNVPPEAAVLFANRLSTLRLSRPVDYQLNRAGGMVIEGERPAIDEEAVVKAEKKLNRSIVRDGRK